MGNRIAVLLVLIALAFGGYFFYEHYHQAGADENGEVTCQGCMTPAEKARFEKEDHGETADGQSEHKSRSAGVDAGAGVPDAAMPAGASATEVAAGAAALGLSAANALTAQAGAVAPPAAQPIRGNIATGTAAVAPMPATDSQPANAPNNVRFSGSGQYQWYRQGNLTWRIDTRSRRSCIIYATMEEWQKQIVMSHGCGRSA